MVEYLHVVGRSAWAEMVQGQTFSIINRNTFLEYFMFYKYAFIFLFFRVLQCLIGTKLFIILIKLTLINYNHLMYSNVLRILVL